MLRRILGQEYDEHPKLLEKKRMINLRNPFFRFVLPLKLKSPKMIRNKVKLKHMISYKKNRFKSKLTSRLQMFYNPQPLCQIINNPIVHMPKRQS